MTNTPHEDEELRKSVGRAFNQYHQSALNYGLNEGASAIDDIMQLIKARDEQRERELLDKIRTIVVKRGAPDNYYGEVWEWIKDGLTNPNQQTGEK